MDTSPPSDDLTRLLSAAKADPSRISAFFAALAGRDVFLLGKPTLSEGVELGDQTLIQSDGTLGAGLLTLNSERGPIIPFWFSLDRMHESMKAIGATTPNVLRIHGQQREGPSGDQRGSSGKPPLSGFDTALTGPDGRGDYRRASP